MFLAVKTHLLWCLVRPIMQQCASQICRIYRPKVVRLLRPDHWTVYGSSS